MESWDSYVHGFMQSDFDGKNMKPVLKNESDKCYCPYKNLYEGFMYIDHTNIDKPLVYWTSKNRLIAEDIYGYIRSPVIVLDKSLQSYPSTKCLTPNMKDYRVEEVLITNNRIIVNLPEAISNSGCEKYNLATTIYTISVSYWTCLDNDLNEFKEFKVQTYEQYYEFQNLTPFTEYTLKLALSNFYVDKLSMGLQFGADVKLSTTGNAPENVTVQVLTPTVTAVYWMPLKKLNCVAINYETERTVDGKFFMTIRSLLPGQKYLIYVRVYPINFSNLFTDSLNKSIYMYSEPNNLILSGVFTNGMNISWIPSVKLKIHYKLEYKNDAMQKWQKVNNTKKNNDEVTYYIENLLPRTKYKFRLILRYPDYMEDFVWPPDERFTFQRLEIE
ncbi:proto-oncogene tyrosine-protein kinase ros [Lasius niger]|uniref:Proto-oncogene tyrosine-protein kinase ros n=1 Tax=Lasius niger TaxID=67767 RepID=A0A0J7K5Y2_LASNI|nr:proto-oncogene tyrosine-protein kinase ros [Lasius niger]